MAINVSQINDHIYLLDANHESTGYLVIGKDKALVIDTMVGRDNVYECARQFTNLPLILINTHGHPDHIYGNVYFTEAYMHPDDWYVANEACINPIFVEELNKQGLKMPPFSDISDGDKIDLGGLHLTIYQIPGHTPGSVLLLLEEDRILFTGDSINHHLWMQLHHCTSLEIYRNNLSNLQFLTKKADYILHGHAQGLDDISLMVKTLEGVEEILAGKTDMDEDYIWFGGKSRSHRIPEDDGVICYTPTSERVLREREAWAKSDAARDAGLTEPSDVVAYKDISYNLFGIHSLLDIYVPRSASPSELLPVLINVHGGGYFYGDKELYRFYAMDMCRYGFIVINFNYRLSPDYKFPSPLQDINEILRFIEANADKYRMDISRVFMMGDSAGAQLTSHYAAINSNPDYARLFSLKPVSIKLRGISLACGIYDMPAAISPESPDECCLDYFAENLTEESLPLLDVFSAITDKYPDTYIFSCPNDFLFEACEPMANLINSRGARATMKIYGTKEMTDVTHVFHCNMYMPIAAKARKDQAEFLLSLK